ncbi:MAG: cytochrome c [Solirubrobacteraceae bacterium]|nr:cytochrome c [Solirubrobacteraceae bacterium]
MRTALTSSSPLGRSAAILATAFAVAVFAGCGGDDSGSGSGSGGGGSVKTITAATDGAQIFKEATCASCHTLAAAGAEGRIGPNLDENKPPAAEVVEKVTNGDGSMPAFKGRLSTEQIQAVAEYVASVEGQ